MIQTYGSAETAAAAGIERKTFQTWLARRVVEVRSRGTGHPREFSFEDVIRLAVIAELDRSGIPVGTAADALVRLGGGFALAVQEIVENRAEKVFLLTRYRDELSVSLVNYDHIRTALSPIRGTEAYHPLSYVIVDLPRLVQAVRSRLEAT